MTPKEYIKKNDYQPLSQVELNTKNKTKIFGTEDLIPWDEVYTRISAGMDMEDIAEIYGNGRKIALWAVHDDIGYSEPLATLVDTEIEQRRKMQTLDKINPTVAKTIHDMANEFAPDVSKSVALFAKELVEKSRTLAGEESVTSGDLLNLAKAVQTTTDVLGLTQRHANAANQTTNHIAVTGFTFELDAPPMQDQLETIDAELE